MVVLLTLVTLNLPSKTSARMKLALGSVFVPLFGLANVTQQSAQQAADAVLTRSELLHQNDQLRRQNEEFRLQAMRADELERENERLRKLFAWQQKQPRKYRLANVVLHDPANWWRTVHIDLGSRDNIRTNMPVLTPEGLVGRVCSVSLTRSQVALLGDSNCKVAARVENPANDTGVIGPAGPLENELVELNYVSGSANLKPGQIVRTSGDGGIFPKDILIGRIVDSEPVEYGLRTVARVRPAANLNALEEVWVMVEP